MNSKFLLASAVAIAGVSALRSAPLESYTYEQWVADFKPNTALSRSFANMHTYAERKAVFNTNVQMIRKHNEEAARGFHSWTMDVNEFADMTDTEFIAKYTGYNQSERILSDPMHFVEGLSKKSATFNSSALPTSVDWISQGAVTATKSQGGCGSCWAFAAATTFESHAFLETGVLAEVSTQQLTSCTPNPKKCGGTGGCFGATAQLAFDYLISTSGVTSESAYPYSSGSSGQTGRCSYDPAVTAPIFKVDKYVQLPANDKGALLEAIATKGPVSVSVAANRFMFYSKGIFDGCSSAGDGVINHAVVAVGYNIEDPLNSYLNIRNSWGSTWGEKGNIRLRINGGEAKETCIWDNEPADGYACDGETDPILVCGECGVFSDSSFPTGITKA